MNKFYLDQAYSRFQKRVTRTKPDAPELPDIVCELGPRYNLGALVQEERNSVAHEQTFDDPFNLSVQAGSRLPHVKLIDTRNPNRKASTLDLVKHNFVLLAVDPDSPWYRAAGSLSLAIDGFVVNNESSPFRDVDNQARKVTKLIDGAALLVRPDGFIAWRAPAVESGHLELLRTTLEAILCKSID